VPGTFRFELPSLARLEQSFPPADCFRCVPRQCIKSSRIARGEKGGRPLLECGGRDYVSCFRYAIKSLTTLGSES
jgi:hypothetical protein